MADPSDQEPPARHWEPRSLDDVSKGTYARLLAIAEEVRYAALLMRREDAYPDFFVESPQQAFHEYVGPPDRDTASLEVRASRMTIADMAGNNYPDFFVESPHNGPPFHERVFQEITPEPPEPPGPGQPGFFDLSPRSQFSTAARIRALSQSKVLQAYMRMLE